MSKKKRSFDLVNGGDRRKDTEQKILWVAEDAPICRTIPKDRRVDEDTLRLIKELFSSTKSREISGVAFVAIRRDGKVDLGASGLMYDSPVIASGAVARLQAMLDAWHEHPGNYLPSYNEN